MGREELDEIDSGFYTEALTLNGWEMGAGKNARFTIGGMNFSQDEVGGPPRVSVAKENGQVIANRLHRGPSYDEEEEDYSQGSEEGLSSDEEEDEVEDEPND
ncbi:hypothetical protein LHYA1_G003852 [Lachnellula hyalina]|uniref:Uncharacterized protein n=1 Tax=Lachnellula hyalina TaxID=1316788 RepID=A0A8H8R1Y0_9HELO|nr:uncharacterized protein LHYA1_G003852 [Lachnellula hyalina]TVY26998.1 hypothetical protein LHYA1_G003852 [Lachnellula hyalina]